MAGLEMLDTAKNFPLTLKPIGRTHYLKAQHSFDSKQRLLVSPPRICGFEPRIRSLDAQIQPCFDTCSKKIHRLSTPSARQIQVALHSVSEITAVATNRKNTPRVVSGEPTTIIFSRFGAIDCRTNSGDEYDEQSGNAGFKIIFMAEASES
jgi:hypothetical protein